MKGFSYGVLLGSPFLLGGSQRFQCQGEEGELRVEAANLILGGGGRVRKRENLALMRAARIKSSPPLQQIRSTG